MGRSSANDGIGTDSAAGTAFGRLLGWSIGAFLGVVGVVVAAARTEGATDRGGTPRALPSASVISTVR